MCIDLRREFELWLRCWKGRQEVPFIPYIYFELQNDRLDRKLRVKMGRDGLEKELVSASAIIVSQCL